MLRGRDQEVRVLEGSGGMRGWLGETGMPLDAIEIDLRRGTTKEVMACI
jgi:hypothetical protein